ncbi:MAG: MBL fold metallo-hydrolase [Dehalococcoidia bacterium]|nr:MAG: MBL fold metallo-hydrolase [Dehalococcoidia bacterium]
MKPFQVHDRIYQIGGPEITASEDCCVYLLDGGSELAVIDSGAGRSVYDLIENIKQFGFNPASVKYVVATHGHIDHIGGLAYLQEKLMAEVVAHELELPAVEGKNIELTAARIYGVKYKSVAVDVVIREEEVVLNVGILKLNCLHTPGHTIGSVSLYVDVEEKRILFGQDIHGPFDPAWGSNTVAWEQSMQKLLVLNSDILCEGHFGIYKPREQVKRYIEGYLRRYGERL